MTRNDTSSNGTQRMRFRGYTELSEREREQAIEYAEKSGMSPTEVMRRMAGWGRYVQTDTEQ